MTKIPLKERVTFEYGYSVRVDSEKSGRFPVYGSNGATGYIDSFKVKGPGVIIGRKGSVGAIHYTDSDFTPTDTAYYLKLNNTERDLLKFWYYYLQLLGLNKLNTHSSVPGLSREIAYFISVQPPTFDDQQRIADVLSSLDAKIELNNRIGAELEAMAKTLYDYWFVQFDFPNANGKPYKISGGKMEYNENIKREIPDGWKVEYLESSSSIIDCLHSKKSQMQYEGEHYYLLQLENIKDDGLLDLRDKYFITKTEYEKWTSRIEVTENDILVTNAGRVAANAQIPSGLTTGIGRNITAIRPTSINPTYLFLAFRGLDIQRQIKWNTDTGSFFSSLNVKGIKKLFVVRPSGNTEKDFEELVRPLRQKRESNNLENQKLAELRDWLLPMLMNGQVTVD